MAFAVYVEFDDGHGRLSDHAISIGSFEDAREIIGEGREDDFWDSVTYQSGFIGSRSDCEVFLIQEYWDLSWEDAKAIWDHEIVLPAL